MQIEDRIFKIIDSKLSKAEILNEIAVGDKFSRDEIYISLGIAAMHLHQPLIEAVIESYQLTDNKINPERKYLGKTIGDWILSYQPDEPELCNLLFSRINAICR